MMILTAKVNLKKTLLILAAVSAVVLSAILILGGGSAETSAPPMSANDGRVAFLKEKGWEVVSTPKESGQVRIPTESSEAFDRYNRLQKDQGYDLTEYAGKKVMRYVYEVTNYPGAEQPVYATLLVHKNKVIGGDITDTAPGGKMHGLTMPQIKTTEPSAQTQRAGNNADERGNSEE